MPIAIANENKGSLKCAKWTVDFANVDGVANEDFQLSGCDAKFETHFNVSCTYENQIQTELAYGQPSHSRFFRKYDIEVSLTQLKEGNDATRSNADRNPVSDYYLQPCNVWIITNENAKIKLKRSSDTSGWNVKSEKFQVNIPNTQSRANPKLTLFTAEIWIEFNRIGQREIKALAHLANYLFVCQNQCDVQFIFENGQQIGGHIQILSARSAVFGAMFNHDMQEAKTGKVTIKDIKSNIFKELLHYVYVGRTESALTDDTAQQLFSAADKYDILDLRNECIEYLLSHIELNNAINIMIWADLHSMENVKNVALDIVVSNAKTICQTEEWDRMAKNYPELNLLATRRIIDIAQFPSNLRK
ncbi:uncharacterized protein LOC130688806 [Daphnia carinata]|uniref:uncharacterized protein LOC130688806 n=1 Tax=Daphnia carinata TaxID=120202 RepID=UPI00257EE5B3|nr:uncharacterized protein LOC130688806 [Daphnia carinata]